MVRGRRAARVRPSEPLRRCVGCRTVRPQRELLRLSARGAELVTGPGPGRGCYLCRDRKCAEKAVKGGRIARALKGRVAEPALDRLLGWLA